MTVIAAELKPPEFDVDRLGARIRDRVQMPKLLRELVGTGVNLVLAKQVVAQSYYRANRWKEAHALFAEVLGDDARSAPPELVAIAARAAFDAAEKHAAGLLVAAVLANPLATPLAIRVVTQVARGTRDPDLIADAASRLHAMLPADPLGLALIGETYVRRAEFREVATRLSAAEKHLDAEGRYWLALARYRLAEPPTGEMVKCCGSEI